MDTRIRQLIAVCVSVGLFAAFSVAPVAAQSGLGLGESGDGISVGGESGVNIGSDGVSVGSDEGVAVNTTSDGAGVELGPAEVDNGGVSVSDQELSSSGGANNISVSNSSELPTDLSEFHATTDDIPQEYRILTRILQTIPEINQTGPEDFPVGDERAPINICDPLNMDGDDLPVGVLPGISDLPDETVPESAPTNLLSNEAVLSLVFGYVPAPCDVVHPNEPQIDPTDVPDEPAGQLDIRRFGQYEYNGSEGGVATFDYDATLNDSGSGPGVSGFSGVLVTEEFGDIDGDLVVDDGRNEYGAAPRLRYNQDSVRVEGALILLGDQVGVALDCDQADGEVLSDVVDTLQIEEIRGNEVGPCRAELIGLPQAITVEVLIDVITGTVDNPPEIVPDPRDGLNITDTGEIVNP